MEGEIQQFMQQNYLPRTNLYYWNVGFYGQDTWRISHNLVADYGVRLEHLGAWTDAHGLGAAVWDPSIYASGADGGQYGLPGFTWHSINSSIPNSRHRLNRTLCRAALRLSWDVYGKGKTVLRGGFGTYRLHDSIVDVTNAFANSQGLRTVYEFGDNGGNTLAGTSTLQLPTTAGGLSTQAFALDPHDHSDPVVYNYSVSIVQSLPAKLLLQVSYVGNNSNSLFNNSNSSTVSLNNLNFLPIGALYQPGAVATALGCAATGCTPPQVTSLSATQIQSVRPYPAYQGLTVPEHVGYSNYNGVQINVQKQAGKLNFNFNYTFGKALGILGSGRGFQLDRAARSNRHPQELRRAQLRPQPRLQRHVFV